MSPKEYRAQRDQNIVDLANANPLMTIKQIAAEVDGASIHIVCMAFRKHGIDRSWTGLPKSKVG